MARMLADAARRAGFALRHDAFFDTIALEVADADALIARAAAAGFDLRRIDATGVGIALDETVTTAELERLAALLGAPLAGAPDSLPAGLGRTTPFLTEPVFHAHRSEHAMLRWLKRLAEKDIALDRGHDPARLLHHEAERGGGDAADHLAGVRRHPPLRAGGPDRGLCGADRAPVRLAVRGDRVRRRCRCSRTPARRANMPGCWRSAPGTRRAARGARDVCLIPASAHGTNPASAAMAGLRVVVVACDRDGNVDLADLRAKVAAHAPRLAALMVTYPSTHGVFEAAIREICALVHDAGGQVYMDGANMNAQVGLTSPASIGADVCHLNLHKTFCIPHGGGGPGVGPIGVAAHLAPYLPNHPLRADAGPATGVGPVAAAPFGSPLILPIPYAYIRLMGAAGLTRATQVAILAANYIAARLRPHYPVLYTGPGRAGGA